jgi:putative ABC transport system substrate-binding protein
MLKKSASVRRPLFCLFGLSGFVVERNQSERPDQPDRPHTKKVVMRPLIIWTVLSVAQGLLFASTSLSEDLVILKSAETSFYQQAGESVRQHLPQSITVKEYTLEGRLEQAQDIGELIRGIHPRLVLAIGLKAALAVRSELPDTPILFCMVVHPEEYGLPAANMVGILNKISPAIQLQQITTLLPKARTIGLLYDDQKTGAFVAEARAKAKKMGLTLVATSVAHREDIAGTLQSLLPRIDLLWIIQDPTIIAEESIDLLIQSSLRHKVPVFTFSTTLVQRGALGALLVRPSDIGLQAAQVAQAMLNHQGPSAPTLLEPELPQLALNLNTAEFLGLSPNEAIVHTAAILFGGPGDVAEIEHALLKELLQ